MSNCSDVAPLLRFRVCLAPMAVAVHAMVAPCLIIARVRDALSCVAAGFGQCGHYMIHLSGLRLARCCVGVAVSARPTHPPPTHPPRRPLSELSIAFHSNWPARRRPRPLADSGRRRGRMASRVSANRKRSGRAVWPALTRRAEALCFHGCGGRHMSWPHTRC
jgi:hypothetical protein